eukprot:7534962-Alexandrium_andersonii.AAC.1
MTSWANDDSQDDPNNDSQELEALREYCDFWNGDICNGDMTHFCMGRGCASRAACVAKAKLLSRR